MSRLKEGLRKVAHAVGYGLAFLTVVATFPISVPLLLLVLKRRSKRNEFTANLHSPLIPDQDQEKIKARTLEYEEHDTPVTSGQQYSSAAPAALTARTSCPFRNSRTPGCDSAAAASNGR